MKEQYPILVRRYLASLIDTLFSFAIAVLVGKCLIAKGFTLDGVSALILVIPFLVYEPILTSYFATLGQFIFRFRVRKLDHKSRISPIHAYFRYFIKITLGIVSLLTIPARKDRRAVHDLAAESIVVEA